MEPNYARYDLEHPEPDIVYGELELHELITHPAQALELHVVTVTPSATSVAWWMTEDGAMPGMVEVWETHRRDPSGATHRRLRCLPMMNHTKPIAIAAVFLVGCAVGGATSRFVVPPANAQQQQATLTKWEYHCFDEHSPDDATQKANVAGREGWELAAGAGAGGKVWCFKRPLAR